MFPADMIKPEGRRNKSFFLRGIITRVIEVEILDVLSSLRVHLQGPSIVRLKWRNADATTNSQENCKKSGVVGEARGNTMDDAALGRSRQKHIRT
jgi:hypothetical protein